MSTIRQAIWITLFTGGAAVVAGCEKQESGDAERAVLYTSVDETIAHQIAALYESKTGRQIELVTDTEAGKTTGLVQRLRLEKAHPRADVFWSSEQSQTLQLADEGVFAPYTSPSAADIPDAYRDPSYLWTGIALRARVLAYDPERTPGKELPTTWEQLAEKRFAGRVAIANPLFGTTRGHAAAMYALWGDARFRGFLTGLVEGGATVTDGNSTAVRLLIAGSVDFACTDSDDVLVAQERGHRVAMTFPDQGDGGTMLIPNTVALISGARHAEAGRQLIDFLLSSKVEEMLAKSESGNYPVRLDLREKLGVNLPPASRLPAKALVTSMNPAMTACREILLR